MIFIRALLIIIFLLISSLVIFSSTKEINIQDFGILSIFFLIILVLGPCWPTKDRQDRIVKFIGSSDLSKFIIYAFVTFICFYYAAGAYFHPDQSYSRGITKLIFDIFGSQGVIIFWLILSLDGITRSYKAFKKMRSRAS
jgi:hypothetical protein